MTLLPVKRGVSAVVYSFSIIGSVLGGPACLSSDYGTTGLIDVPTARMQSDGSLTVGAAFDGLHQSYFATYQALPWLEGTFRYTGFEDFFFWDRNYAVKARLIEERSFFPQVAVGIRDVIGTGQFGAEYIVGTKRISNFDFTLGLGWGRLAGSGNFKNPLGLLDDRFDTRPESQGIEQSGQLRPVFFRGDKAGVFGGVSYNFSSLPLSFIAEYNPDQYEFNNRGKRPEYKPSSPISYGFKWSASPGVSVALTHQHGDHLALSVSSVLDTKSLPPSAESPAFISSLYLPQSSLPNQIKKSSWYDRLLFDVERAGLLLVEARISDDGATAQLVIGNTSFSLWSDALAHHLAFADLHLPASVKDIYFIIEDGGHRSATLVMPRPSQYIRDTNVLSEARLLNGRTIYEPSNRTLFATGKVLTNMALKTKFQLFDPDDPARYQLYLSLSSEYAINNHWGIKSGLAIDLDSNFDRSRRLNSDSALPNVRTGVVKYLTEGKTGIEFLLLEGRDTIGHSLHYRAFAGVLEEMYSGVGGEVLWWPSRSRLSFGASLAFVKQRAFDRSLDHLNYEVLTGFVSAYWATPWYNYDVAVHVGQYLAKDVGATLEIRRTFRNGWQVGLFGTFTNVPFETFGEGAFDKGFFFQVPLANLFGERTRSNISTRIRPVLRDGGQRLENHSGNIFWDLRQSRYDALKIDERLLK